MAGQKYAFEKYDAERMAKAAGVDLGISTKQAIEICSALRRKNLQKAKALLEDVIAMKKPIQFKRFTNGIGHKKGDMGAGAYPVKAATAFLSLLNSVEINAQNKGLNTGQLAIIHICAHKAARPMHYGRKGRSEFKRSHVEVVVAEQKEPEKKKNESKAPAKAKPEVSKEVKKEEKAAPAEKKDTAKEEKPEPKAELKKEETVEVKEAPKDEKKPEAAPEKKEATVEKAEESQSKEKQEAEDKK